MRRVKAMVLDDEPIVGRRLKPAIEKLGIEVEVFEDPLEARARLEEEAFDVVITDVKMRGLDGLQLLDAIRARGRSTRVILITGYPSNELAAQALARGAFEVLAKPFKTASLCAVIERAVEAGAAGGGETAGT